MIRVNKSTFFATSFRPHEKADKNSDLRAGLLVPCQLPQLPYCSRSSQELVAFSVALAPMLLFASFPRNDAVVN